jgi:hypothetical protein
MDGCFGKKCWTGWRRLLFFIFERIFFYLVAISYVSRMCLRSLYDFRKDKKCIFSFEDILVFEK